MVVFSFNKKAGKAAMIAVFAALLIMLCALISCERKDKIPPTSSNDEVGEFFTEVSDSDSLGEFLAQFGLKAAQKPLIEDEVTIPSDFGEQYISYNKLQKKAGFDLSRFKGVTVNRVTLRGDNQRITLLIYKGHIIGGHLSTGEFGDSYKPLTG